MPTFISPRSCFHFIRTSVVERKHSQDGEKFVNKESKDLLVGQFVLVKENENSNLEQKILDYEQQSKIEIEQLHQNFTLKLDQTLKKFQESQKDKTSSMVMK